MNTGTYKHDGQNWVKVSDHASGPKDVFFKSPYFDSHLGDDNHVNGQNITSRSHKARVMKEQGVSEGGDRVHGSR